MSQRPASQCTRVAAPAVSGQAAARRRHTSSLEQLQCMSLRLDRLIRDAVIGSTSHNQHDRVVAEAEAIAAGIRAAYRGPVAAPSENPPLQQQGGSAWW